MLKLLSAAIVATGVAATALGTFSHADTPTNKDLVREALKTVFQDFDADAARKMFREDYIQHNPHVPTGREAILGVLPLLKEQGLRATHHRFIQDGDLVAVHTTYTNAQLFGGETMIAFDIMRVEDGLMAEHWDALQPMVTETVSGRSQVDGPVEITDLDKTDANKALVRGLVETVLIGGDAAALPRFVSTETYHQHNPQIGDGLDGVQAAFKALAEQGLMFQYDNVHMVIGEGNFVLTASEGSFGGKPTAFYDLFRVADGKIVEHWDVIQEIPAQMAHDNGMF